jgi:intracellular sulfur oxidation DsrE/DsrF family protein
MLVVFIQWITMYPRSMIQKKISIVLAIICTSVLWSQEPAVKIVFDVTSADEATHKSAIRHVKMMAEAYPKSEFELVMYSKAMNMALADKSVVAEDMSKLAKNENVSFKICAATMNRNKVEEAQLVKGVDVVPDGIMEIITKQAEGWGYIKEAHQ